jgi:hypothetical protein
MLGLSSRSGSMVRCKFFHEHAGKDMAFEKSRGIEIGFGKFYGVDRLSPMPSSIDNVEEVEEDKE